MKKANLRKLVSFIVAFAMVFSLFMPSARSTAYAAEGDKVFDLVEITDFHGALLSSSGLPVGAVLGKNVKDVKSANPDRTLVIGGGDLYQGSAISNMLYGVPVQKMMDNLGMEVTALGNHEFDWGLEKVTDVAMKDAKYSVICANLYKKSTGKRVFEPYKIIEKDGVKIALVGAITQETPTIVMPTFVQDYNFTDIVTEVNNAAKEAKSKGAKVVLAVIHEGDNKDGKTGKIVDIAGKLVGVNAVFAGHSHSTLNTTVNGIPVYNANTAGNGFIHAKMTLSTNGNVSFEGNYIDLNNDKPTGYRAASPVQDPEVKVIVEEANKQVLPITSEKLGILTEDANRTQKGTPYGESYLGNWMSDAMRVKVKADVALTNNGGIRADVPKGDVTVGTIWSVMPFDNEIAVVNTTKDQLINILEQAFMDGGKGIQVSGIKVVYDSKRPSLHRVVDVTREDGKAIGANEVLKVATSNFLAEGGDGFTEFKTVGGTDPKNNTRILIRDALSEYVKAKGTITTTMNSRLENKEVATANTINVLATTDLHGNIYPYDYFGSKAANHGIAKVATYVKSVKAKNPNVMLIDNGDTIQGTPLSYYYNIVDTKSEFPMIKAMGAMGYSTWTFGNHEFNYGLTNLERIIKDAEKYGINPLSANTVKTSNNAPYTKPYFIKSFNINGVTKKIAVLGLTTQRIPSWENPDNYKGLKFVDPVEEAKKWVPVIKAEGADVIIASFHSGKSQATSLPGEDQVVDLATKVSGIDVIVAGHTHKAIGEEYFINPSGKKVLLTQPNKWGSHVSQIDIALDAVGNINYISTKVVPMTDAIAADQEILDLTKSYQDKTLEYVDTILGKANGEYSGKDQNFKPTAIMDLINIVQMQAAGTQLSIAAPLSASAYIPSGDVKIKDLMGVYIYENFLYGVKMNGAQIKAWMEHSVKFYKQVSSEADKIEKDPVLNVPDYNLDFLYGATYDVDLTQPVGKRIKNLKYNGKLIGDKDVFTVAINNYRYNGGGDFMKAAGISNTDPSIVIYDSQKVHGDDGQVRSYMMSYIEKNKTITPSVSDNWKLHTTEVKQEVAPVVSAPVPAPVKVEQPKSVKTIKVVANKGLRVRAAANTSSKTLNVLKNGTTVTVEQVVGDWYKINYNGLKGYIHKAYTK